MLRYTEVLRIENKKTKNNTNSYYVKNSKTQTGNKKKHCWPSQKRKLKKNIFIASSYVCIKDNLSKSTTLKYKLKSSCF